VAGNVPIGAGHSSSAALEVATARALAAVDGLAWEPDAMARLCQKAENDFVGMACGLMDQFASACSRDGQALLLDCRTLATEDVPLPENAAIVVMDTGVRRSLARSAYNDRRAACDQAVAVLREIDPSARALRDITPEVLAAGKSQLDPLVWKRAAHVVAENRRPLDFAVALRANDLRAAGALMDASHASLRDLYEVSCAELDYMVTLARARPACHGARMTGAGFGGCAVALVDRDAADWFARDVESEYRETANPKASCFACRPEGGARLA
jgi:galactokinase